MAPNSEHILKSHYPSIFLSVVTRKLRNNIRLFSVFLFFLIFFILIVIKIIHIWLAKTKENHPNLTHFICTLKSQHEIEIESGDTKKWKHLAGYDDLINIKLNYLYPSVFISYSLAFS